MSDHPACLLALVNVYNEGIKEFIIAGVMFIDTCKFPTNVKIAIVFRASVKNGRPHVTHEPRVQGPFPFHWHFMDIRVVCS
jgi:hypothetical protein